MWTFMQVLQWVRHISALIAICMFYFLCPAWIEIKLSRKVSILIRLNTQTHRQCHVKGCICILSFCEKKKKQININWNLYFDSLYPSKTFAHITKYKTSLVSMCQKAIHFNTNPMFSIAKKTHTLYEKTLNFRFYWANKYKIKSNKRKLNIPNVVSYLPVECLPFYSVTWIESVFIIVSVQ